MRRSRSSVAAALEISSSLSCKPTGGRYLRSDIAQKVMLAVVSVRRSIPSIHPCTCNDRPFSTELARRHCQISVSLVRNDFLSTASCYDAPIAGLQPVLRVPSDQPACTPLKLVEIPAFLNSDVMSGRQPSVMNPQSSLGTLPLVVWSVLGSCSPLKRCLHRALATGQKTRNGFIKVHHIRLS